MVSLGGSVVIATSSPLILIDTFDFCDEDVVDDESSVGAGRVFCVMDINNVTVVAITMLIQTSNDPLASFFSLPIAATDIFLQFCITFRYQDKRQKCADCSFYHKSLPFIHF